MRNVIKMAAAIAVSGLLLATGAWAGAPASSNDPKVSAEQARKTALAKVPRGTVTAEELERENGHLIYSFELTVPGRSGVEEVNVDARSGKVLSVEHESPAQEKSEK